MKSTRHGKRWCRKLKGLLIGSILLAPLGGCPIDSDAAFVAAFEAVLVSATDSLVTSLGDYLSDEAAGSVGGG